MWSSFEEAREKLSPFVGLADICFGLEPIQLFNESGKDVKDELGLKRPYENKEVLLLELNAKYGFLDNLGKNYKMF